MGIRRHEHFIGGKHTPPASGEYFASIDPSNGQRFAEVARGNAEDVDRAVEAARRSLKAWRKVEPSERGRILNRVAARILREADDLARMESIDTGFPLRDCSLVVQAVAARYFEYYGGLTDKLGGETIPVPGNHLDYTLREPLGVVAQIIPWNSPLYDGSRGIAPALAAANTIVLKPAEEAMVTMLRLAEIMTEEGLPEGVFNVVTGYGPEAGAALAGHPGINGICFTGSVETGTQVMKLAADNVVPVSLELGGKSANIIFDDADLDMAVMWAVIAIFTASGQICTAGSRLLLDKKVQDEFLDKLVARTRQLKVGPGLESLDLGPLISESQLERVLSYIEVGKAEGAQVATGGERLIEGALAQGYFVAPTIFVGVENQMRIAQEEIFGPVLSVLTFETEDQALEIANGTQYGLAAAVWTRNLKRAHYLASQLEVGSVYINRYYPSGVEAPAGGYKRSGFGRVDGIETLRHFTQIKNVVINLD
jgi:acyl-CoA reductase-like NAD-dependent aldehyde dehydrogenase